MGIWLVVMAFAVYAFFSGGPGNLQWLYPNELFPTDIRASAVGVIMSLSRIGTIVSTWALPIFINNYGISNTMLMGAGISLFGLLISVAFAPETRGMSLAQTSNMTIRGQRMGLFVQISLFSESILLTISRVNIRLHFVGKQRRKHAG